MPSLKRKHSAQQNLRVKKMRMCEDDCVLENNFQKATMLSDCKISSQGIQTSDIMFRKIHRKVEMNFFKKRNFGKSTDAYDSIGSVWTVIDIHNFQYENVKSRSDMKKVHSKNKNDKAFEEADTILKSRNSVSYGSKKEIRKSGDTFEGYENAAVSKNRKKQELKKKVIQPKVCSAEGMNTPSVFEDTKMSISEDEEDELTRKMKRKVSKLIIESDDENEVEKDGKEENEEVEKDEREENEEVEKDGKKKSEKFVKNDTVRYSFIESDSEGDEEDNDFIVDDNYISYDEDATSSDECEDTDYSDDQGAGDDDDDDDDDDREDEEEEEEEECLPLKRSRGRMAMQFLDLEAEEGEETEADESEEEETSDEDDDDDDDDAEDSIVGVEQFIHSEAKDVTFFRRKKKVKVIDSEEEEQAEKKDLVETERLEKAVHIMKKLTRIMTAGHLKGRALRKQVNINKIGKEIEEYEENGSEIRNKKNQSYYVTGKAANERKIMSDGRNENQIMEELQIREKVGEEIREILGDDKFGKKKQRKSVTDLGRGYSSDTEYVETNNSRMKSNRFLS